MGLQNLGLIFTFALPFLYHVGHTCILLCPWFKDKLFALAEPGAVAWLVACLLRKRAALRLTLLSGKFFHVETFPSSADSRRASCCLLAKEWTLNTGKLSQGGLQRSSVVK